MSSKENKENIGKLTTFHEMLNHTDRKIRFDRILIPKIQRDYAQGRKGRAAVRQRFLSRLFGAIDNPGAEARELDFIYGKRNEDKYEFEPIDGQQRLTTLFLLHLYLGKRCGKDVSALKNFTYDTRESSKEFCLKLLSIPGEHYRGIRSYIENQWWFTLRWASDPTIDSMLTMLHDIDTHYAGIPDAGLADIWKRLTEDGNIKFWRLDLKDLDTTDEMYIKMNSRGKPLTDFEHFKAEIESYFKSEDEAIGKNHEAELFSLKIDTVWTGLLWQYRNEKVDKDPKRYALNGLDSMFTNIFRRFMIIEETKSGGNYNNLEKLDSLSLASIALENKTERITRFTRIMDFFANLPSVSFFFNSILTPHAEEVRAKEEIKICSDNYRIYLQSPLDGDTDYLLRCAQWNRLTMPNMLMMEAFFQFADSHLAIDYVYIRNKIRIVRNLILNSPDEIRADNMGALLRRVDAVMDNVPLDATASKEFRQIQVRQEIYKLEYIKDHPDEEWIIKFTENHKLLCGNLASYMNGRTVLTPLLPLHTALFHSSADYSLIERTLLTYGDYGADTRDRRLYGGHNWWVWKTDIFTTVNKLTPPILHKALTSLKAFDNDTLIARISEWLKDQKDKKRFSWAYYMVCHKGMRKGDEARYAKREDFISYDYMMMNRTNYNGKHWNPYLFCLSKKLADLKPDLGEYGAPLIFEKEEIRIKGHESKFEIIFKDDSRKFLEIPQKDHEGQLIDTEDRIEMAEAYLRKHIATLPHQTTPASGS